jgi:N-hydroxyarylamine O-acetyltransferase
MNDVLARIGLDRLPAPDVDGLFALHRSFLERVPYEALAVQLGETGPLDEAALLARLARDGRGGYCFELNTVLAALLREAGFRVTHHQAVVGTEGLVNHMTLVVDLGPDGRWLADAGLGEGFLEPLPLVEGRVERSPFAWTLTHEAEDEAWYLAHHEWGSFSGFRMAEAVSAVADFNPHHRRLATEPSSMFVQTLVVQKPLADRIVTLRARTLSVVGPGLESKRVVEDEDEFGAVLRDEFGITMGGERLARLWTQAVAQHETFLARV